MKKNFIKIYTIIYKNLVSKLYVTNKPFKVE